MKFAIEITIVITLLLNSSTHADTMREQVLRNSALDSGLVPPAEVQPFIFEKKSEAGRRLFESTALSLNRQTSCQTCHLDVFSSADGLPNAIGTGGVGEGPARHSGGGDVVPRNTLPLWGRGSVGFNVFFWDGKVDGTTDPIHSQFGDRPPSQDPLTVAVHLPIVEIREMISDVRDINALRTETVSSAEQVYRQIEERIRTDPELSTALTTAYEVTPNALSISHIAGAISEFIRDRFRLRDTRFHQFVFSDGVLSQKEIDGGLIFYGKGRCATCHNGAFFSDLKFHAIPFAQAGFGKNGFGIDYGRFNVTLAPSDRYRFRTPPLFNVSQTAPYSHSGNTYELGDAIRAHTDPLSVIDIDQLTAIDRVEFYKRLRAWSVGANYEVALDSSEIEAVISFLRTLEFDPSNDLH